MAQYLARDTDPGGALARVTVAALAARVRVSTSTSFLGFGLQAVLLLGHAPLVPLLAWLAAMLAAEGASGWLARGLHDGLSDAQRRQQLGRLALALTCSGTVWGLAAWLPDDPDGLKIGVYNLLILAATAIFSAHNLALHQPSLLGFSGGLCASMALGALLQPGVPHWPLAAGSMVLWLLVWVYGRTTRRLMREALAARLSAERLAEDLQARNRDLQTAMSTIATLASHDPLTGALNRRALAERLATEQARSQRGGTPIGLAMLDLDHFKAINDGHGHAAGDAVLVALAQRLRDRLRGTDLLVRWGGEEFLCVLPGIDAAALAQVAEQLRQAVAERPLVEQPQRLAVTVSVGTALLQPGDDAEAAIARADQALYRAKHGGRNRVEA